MEETITLPQPPNTVFCRRLIIEICNMHDPPANFEEFMVLHTQIEMILEHLDIPVQPLEERLVFMLQQFPFTWEILSGISQMTSIDTTTDIIPFSECKVPITSGYKELDEHIPTHLKICRHTHEVTKEGVIILEESKPPYCMSLEACVSVFENDRPDDFKFATILPANHPRAIETVHCEAIQMLLAKANTVETNKDEASLTGKIVEVIVETDKDDSVEFFLVTEYNSDKQELFGFWLYKPSEMPGDWDTEEEDSIETEADDKRLFFSDHFDTVHIDSLSERSKGPTSIKLTDLLPRFAGAWCSKHNMAFLGQARVRTFVDMLKVINEMEYEHAKLRIWRNLFDRASAILPSGVDSCLQRAQDLQEKLWDGDVLTKLNCSTFGLCDCCGLQRTLSFEFGTGWYVGKTCAVKIQSLLPEIEDAKNM